VLLEEGVEGVEEGHAALVEHALLNDLVCPQQDGWRDREAQRLGGLEVYHQFELRRLLDGYVSGFRTFQDLDVISTLASCPA
jgi:hypothetical protein